MGTVQGGPSLEIQDQKHREHRFQVVILRVLTYGEPFVEYPEEDGRSPLKQSGKHFKRAYDTQKRLDTTHREQFPHLTRWRPSVDHFDQIRRGNLRGRGSPGGRTNGGGRIGEQCQHSPLRLNH